MGFVSGLELNSVSVAHAVAQILAAQQGTREQIVDLQSAHARPVARRQQQQRSENEGHLECMVNINYLFHYLI